MSLKQIGSGILLVTVLASVFLLRRPLLEHPAASLKTIVSHIHPAGENEEGEENEEEYTVERLAQEFKMLRNPITGTIPANFHEIELDAASKIPSRNRDYNPWLSGISGSNTVTTQNTYQNVGPNNVAGRSRTLAFDRRNSSIMLTGGPTGGIFRSTDGGVSWTFVTSETDIRSATAITQDPLNPDTWYCGTGEAYYVSSQADISVSGVPYGHGIFKSTDNGVTWKPLTATQGNQNAFDSPFDLVHRLVVHPVTGYIYAAVHRRIMRSKDGGATWEQVLGSTIPSTALGGVTDIIIPSTGSKIFAAVTGNNPDRTLVGVWQSTTGDASSWTRIAGGVAGQPDSIAGWRAYNKWDRIVLALNSANTNLFVLYKNGDSASGPTPKPEADLYRCNISSGNSTTYAWTNLSAYVPNEGKNIAGIDPYTTQFNGYNMSIAVKPDNDNMLFIGGTCLDRVDLTQTTTATKFRRIGGYGQGFFPNSFNYPNHHPDIHGIYFLPGSSTTMYTADDGGIQKTTSVLADTVQWTPLNASLQTLQYQYVNINPDVDYDFIIGGAQDNGTLINLNAPTSLEHSQFTGGDGASCAITSFTKNGNIWKQYWYSSVVQGDIYRDNIILNTTTSNISDTLFAKITPTGLSGNGQFLTLFINDPDSTEHIYYNNKNKLYRTTAASTVTSSTWTQMTGVSSTVPSSENFSSMAISKRFHGIKYLYFGTDNGHVYRLDNANTASPAATPVSITPTGMAAGSYVANIAVNPRNPDTVLAVVSNYDAGATVISNIFWTGNATSATPTWQILDGALEPVSSQSCAIVVKTTGVEYYVGTSVGLYSTTAINGNTTAWLREGSGMMTTAIIRSLVNRQKDNTLVVGTHGNGAFLAQIGGAVTITDVVTAINDPVINDKNFIRTSYPTISTGTVQYFIGNRYTIKKIAVRLLNMQGQQVYRQETGYQDGTVNTYGLPAGQYILVIDSDDGQYRYVQKIMRQ